MEKVKLKKKTYAILRRWSKELSDLIGDECDLRIKGESVFVDETIIVGYHDGFNFSPKITHYEGDNSGFRFEMEDKGHYNSIGYISEVDPKLEDAFQAYLLYIRKHMEYEEMQFERKINWPNMIKSDERNRKLENIIPSN